MYCYYQVCSIYLLTGTFNLSCNALSMVRFLENKFAWAHVVASQKGVVFSVQDSSLATEFGPSDVIDPTVGEQWLKCCRIDIPP